MSPDRARYFPDFITALPQPDSPLEGLQAWMLQTNDAMGMFFELPDGVHVPAHAHGAQWGVVLEGSIEFTIGEGEVVPGFEQAVTGMTAGEKKTTTIAAAPSSASRIRATPSRAPPVA